MNEECNYLVEHFNVIKRAGKMIYGEEIMKKVVALPNLDREEV